MFTNIGGKLKGVARAIAWGGIILSVILGLFTMAEDDDLILSGLIFIIVGCLSSWISSLSLYGFGQLVENSDKLVNSNNKIFRATEELVRFKEEERARERSNS